MNDQISSTYTTRNIWRIVRRTYMLILGLKDVRANCFCASYCARNSLPRHALSVHAVGEMWRYIALVGTSVSMHGFNSLTCSVTPYFLLIIHFLCQLSTFWEKLKKICIVEVWFFSTFLPSHHRIMLLL